MEKAMSPFKPSRKVRGSGKNRFMGFSFLYVHIPFSALCSMRMERLYLFFCLWLQQIEKKNGKIVFPFWIS